MQPLHVAASDPAKACAGQAVIDSLRHCHVAKARDDETELVCFLPAKAGAKSHLGIRRGLELYGNPNPKKNRKQGPTPGPRLSC